MGKCSILEAMLMTKTMLSSIIIKNQISYACFYQGFYFNLGLSFHCLSAYENEIGFMKLILNAYASLLISNQPVCRDSGIAQ